MNNITDEGLRQEARNIIGQELIIVLGTMTRGADLVDKVATALQQVRDAAKKEEMERAACIAESWDFYYDFIPKSIGPKIARAIRQMEGGK